MKLPEIARELNTLIRDQALELKKHSPNELVRAIRKFDDRRLSLFKHKKPVEKPSLSFVELGKNMRIQNPKAQIGDRSIGLMNAGEAFLKVKSFHKSFEISNARRCLRRNLPEFAIPKEPLSQALMILPSKLKY